MSGTLKTKEDPGFYVLMKIKGEPVRVVGRSQIGSGRQAIPLLCVETTRPPLALTQEAVSAGVRSSDLSVDVSDSVQVY